MVNPTKVINDQFFTDRSEVNKVTGCIEWTRHLNQGGYGTLKHRRKTQMAHRAMWEYKNGSIPDGMIICHKCDNRKCINPDHLFIGATQDNVDDKMAKGRFVVRKGEQSGTAKLTAADIEAIRLDTRAQHVIAKDYGVSQANISLVKRGKTWDGVPVSEDKRMKLHELARLFNVPYGKLNHHLIRYQRGFRRSLELCGASIDG